MHLVVLMVGAPTLVGEPIRTSLGRGRKTWFNLYTPGGADGGSTEISGGTNQIIFGGEGGRRAGRKHGSVSIHLVVLMVGAPTLVGEPIRTSLGGGKETWFSLYAPGGADGGSTDISGGTN
ncbi:hypothetical protein RRG08_005584 [Elysia crispata]|uniref:Uncharacterized protein n=1 Tax=Elysia crispata TaxID=231223 RepID=A0AAE0Z898_9GAST|nr:hypothetical protein RRG08_005584 [Elysia crispata]